MSGNIWREMGMPRLLLALAAMAVMTGCAGVEQGAPQDQPGRAGVFKNGVYQNDFFKFTWRPPAAYQPAQPQAAAKPLFYNGPLEQVFCAWRDGQAEAGLMAYGPHEELPLGQLLEQSAQALARWQQWRLIGQHAVNWEGEAVLDVFYQQGESSQTGPARQVMARLWRQGPDLLVFYLRLPEADFEALRAAFLALMEGARPIRPEPPAPLAQEKVPPADLTHTVQQGDTPAYIAQWYTGRAENWRDILKHNNLKSSSGLHIGQQIVIPGPMVVKREPLPKVKPRPRLPGLFGESTRPAPADQAEPAQGGGAGPGVLLEPTGPK